MFLRRGAHMHAGRRRARVADALQAGTRARGAVYKPFIKPDKSKSPASTAAFGETAEQEGLLGV